MSAIPPPSTLIFLNDLPATTPGSKVRFLGCVTKYSTGSGLLYLEHAYTRPAREPPLHPITVAVDISLLEESLKTTNTEMGEWVNVIGYVEGQLHEMTRDRALELKVGKCELGVQALILWSAGPVRLDEYERATEGRMAMMPL